MRYMDGHRQQSNPAGTRSASCQAGSRWSSGVPAMRFELTFDGFGSVAASAQLGDAPGKTAAQDTFTAADRRPLVGRDTCGP